VVLLPMRATAGAADGSDVGVGDRRPHPRPHHYVRPGTASLGVDEHINCGGPVGPVSTGRVAIMVDLTV
jgi:hypothetical protein